MPVGPEKEKAIELAVSSIEKAFGKGSIMRLGNEEAMVKDVQAISTGSVSLDIALGVGGLPRGRIIEIYGPESSGKTTLALHAIAEAQKKGGIAAFIDAEHALDVGYARKLGVRTDDLLISQPDTGEQALEITETLVRSGAVDVLVIDSVAALVPKAELEGEMGDAHMGVQARLMSQALRKLTGTISKSSTIVIFINQIRMKIGVMFGNPETTTGGNALKFYATQRLDIRRIGAIKDGDAGDRQPHPRQGGEEQGRPALQGGRVRHHVRPGDQPRGRRARPRLERQHRREERHLVQLRRRADRPGPRAGQGLPPRAPGDPPAGRGEALREVRHPPRPGRRARRPRRSLPRRRTRRTSGRSTPRGASPRDLAGCLPETAGTHRGRPREGPAPPLSRTAVRRRPGRRRDERAQCAKPRSRLHSLQGRRSGAGELTWRGPSQIPDWLGTLIDQALASHDPAAARCQLPPDQFAAGQPVDYAAASRILVARSLRTRRSPEVRLPAQESFRQTILDHLTLLLDLRLLDPRPAGVDPVAARAELAAFLAGATGEEELALSAAAPPSATRVRAIERALAAAGARLRARFFPPGDPVLGLPLSSGSVAVFRRHLARIAGGFLRTGGLDLEALQRHAEYAARELALLAEALAGLLDSAVAAGPAGELGPVAADGPARAPRSLLREAREGMASPRQPRGAGPVAAPEPVRAFLFEQILLAQLRTRLPGEAPARFAEAFA